MLSKEFLSKQIPILKPSDSGNYALSLMEDLKLKHLPVVNEDQYVFLLSDKDVSLMGNTEAPIENISLFAPCVREETLIHDVLQIISHDKLSLLPVIEPTGKYIGSITLESLVEKLSEISNTGTHGATIALEMNPQDYSLSHIAHLAESNNAKILSLFSYLVDSTGKLIILIKVDLEDVTPVLRSLERFNYRILYFSQKQGLSDETLKNRLDELMYYLEM